MAREIKKIGRLWPLAALLALPAGCGPTRPNAPTASLAVRVRAGPWRFGGLPGRKLSTRHYNLYTTTRNRSLLKVLPGFLESAHEHYLRLTGLPEPARGARAMPVYLLANRQQWAIMTEEITGPLSRLYLSIESGGYCFRGVCVFWDLGYFATFAVAAHEGCHQFLHHRLADPIPAWADEGLAVLAEGFDITRTTVTFSPRRNTLRQGNLRRAISAGRWIPLKKLLCSDAADHVARSPLTSPEYYGHLWALMMFIRSEPRYRAGLERMIADAAGGRLRRALRVPPAMGAGRTYSRAMAMPVFRHYVEPDVAGFGRRLREFAERLAKLK